MEHLKSYLLGVFGSFNQEQWTWMGAALLLVLYVLWNRKKYVDLFDKAVIMAETSFNYGANKEKLEAAIDYVMTKTALLPFPARLILQYFLSRENVITLIEKSLQKFSDVFGSKRRVDIKGNESNGTH